MPQGMLEVVIVDASGLEKTDFLSSTDAYCLVSCQDQEKNSKVATVEGSAPTWNETFMFSISENVKELKIKIMDKDTLSADDLVGEVTIPLEPAYEVEKVPVTMYNVVKDEILCGGLNVNLTFTQQKVQSRGFSGDLFRNNIGRLPYDILIKIFSRMPIMSLMSLREVEKSWRHIIDTANFNTKEFNLAVGICDRNCTEIRLFDILEDSIGGEISSFKVAEFSTIIGSVDGFLVVVDPEQINIINPLMNQVLCYLKPYGGYSMIRTLVYGFGKTVDSVYKLLVIRQEKGDLVTDCTLTTVGGEAHWRSLVIKDTYQYDFGDGLVYLNSHQHWLVSEPRKEHPSMVCAFNFDTEKFRYFSMPEIFLSPTDRLEGGTRASAFILDDKLCVCVPTYYPVHLHLENGAVWRCIILDEVS